MSEEVIADGPTRVARQGRQPKAPSPYPYLEIRRLEDYGAWLSSPTDGVGDVEAP
jgi:hypothetical protein